MEAQLLRNGFVLRSLLVKAVRFCCFFYVIHNQVRATPPNGQP
jgi:hypothetical protein